jgi:hypothetical protein
LGLITSAVHGVERRTLELSVAAHDAPPRITLGWDEQLSGYEISIYRRLLGQMGGTWSNAPLAVVTHPQRTCVDSNVTAGVVYEYKVARPYYDAMHEDVSAYVCAGIDVPEEPARGTLLLVIDDTMAAALQPEIDLLELDLIGDGWTVLRRTFARHGSATPPQLRGFIQNVYTTAPGGLTAVYLLGKLPYAQSGSMAPDGHSAHPQHADVFYADMDGTWSDSDGDGVYSDNYVPGNRLAEVQLGRVDMAGMGAWPINEEQLLRLYLHKSHAFRTGLLEVPRTGIYASGYCDVEWQNVIAMFGPGAAVKGGTGANGQAFSEAEVRPYLWGVDFYDWRGANYPYHRIKVQFAINFGSGKLYWQNNNNAMRGILAQPTYGLTCAWGSRPNWYFHHMSMGATVGYTALRTQSNYSGLQDYSPACHYWFGGGSHVALMGDPSLRMHVVLPPRAPWAEADGVTAIVHWAASLDPQVHGYEVHRCGTLTGSYTKLTGTPVSGTSFPDSGARTGTVYYMVKALKRELVNGGSYSNSSAGVFTMLKLDGSGNTPPSGANAVTITPQNTAVTVRLTGTDADGDDVHFGILRQGSNGWLGGASNVWTYTPDAGFHGTDSFVYMVYDLMSTARGGTVDVVVVAPNTPPVAYSQTVSNMLNTAFPITLTGDDGDGDPLDYLLMTYPTMGSMTGAPPELVYWSSIAGTDAFTFAVSDGVVTSAPATVTVIVMPEPVGVLPLVLLALARPARHACRCVPSQAPV